MINGLKLRLMVNGLGLINDKDLTELLLELVLMINMCSTSPINRKLGPILLNTFFTTGTTIKIFIFKQHLGFRMNVASKYQKPNRTRTLFAVL